MFEKNAESAGSAREDNRHFVTAIKQIGFGLVVRRNRV
jgi:hypothetical protein